MAPPVQRSVWLRVAQRARPFRGLLLVALGASLIAAGASAVWASLSGPVLNALLTGGSIHWAGFEVSSDSWAVRLPVAVAGLAVIRAIAAWLHAGWVGKAAQGVMLKLREDLYDRLLSLPPSWFERRHSGELLTRFTSDVTQLELASTQALLSLTKDSLQVLSLLVVCWVTDWRLFLVAFVVLPGTIIPVSRFARSAKKAATRSQSSLGTLTMIASEQLQNLPVVQSARAEGKALKAFDAEQDRYLGIMKRSLFIRGAFSPTTEFLGVIGVAAALVLGARAVQADPSLAKSLVSFLTSALLLYQPLKALSNTTSQLAQGAGAATRLFEVLDASPDVDAGGNAGPLTAELALKDVKLTYSDGREALKGVSFTVPRGKLVALVGASGAGKSSVLAVLLGHVTSSAGQVTWDGAPLRSFSRRSVRERVAWVPQEPVLLSGTVRENLLLGKPDATEAQLWTALERAHAHTFVRALPKGLDESVGERGSTLSGGQRQRLAIARAFLREPSLLLLDEPTSALDAATQAEVQAGLAALMEGRTTLVIAHRLSTVRHADWLVVMEDGRVIEEGRHDALLSAKGAYSKLHFASGETV